MLDFLIKYEIGKFVNVVSIDLNQGRRFLIVF